MNQSIAHNPIRTPGTGLRVAKQTGWTSLVKGLLFMALATLAISTAAEARERRRADLSRLVVVGDSISAGHQNSSLMAAQQVNRYASLIARQAGVELTLR